MPESPEELGARMRRFGERIQNAIQEAIQAGELAGGGFTQEFVLVCNYMDSDGDYRIGLCTQTEGRLSGTLGLLDVAQVIYRDEALEWARRDDTD